MLDPSGVQELPAADVALCTHLGSPPATGTVRIPPDCEYTTQLPSGDQSRSYFQEPLK
jgi:hypothetical protein